MRLYRKSTAASRSGSDRGGTGGRYGGKKKGGDELLKEK